MEKFERLFKLYKINYSIIDTNYIDEKFVIGENPFLKFKFKFLFIKNKDNNIDDIEYLLSNVYKNIKEHQNKKLINKK